MESDSIKRRKITKNKIFDTYIYVFPKLAKYSDLNVLCNKKISKNIQQNP